MADPDFQIRGEGGGGGVSHPDPKIRGGGGASLKKKFFRPQFGLKIRGVGSRASPPDPPLQPPHNLIPQFQDVCLFLY